MYAVCYTIYIFFQSLDSIFLDFGLCISQSLKSMDYLSNFSRITTVDPFQRVK